MNPCLPYQADDLGQKSPFRRSDLELPRIALVETYFHDMDAGWTRFLFDTYHIPFTVLHPERFHGDRSGGRI